MRIHCIWLLGVHMYMHVAARRAHVHACLVPLINRLTRGDVVDISQVVLCQHAL